MNPTDPKMPVTQAETEPTADISPVPVWLIVLLGALIYWCQLYLDGHAGGFSKDVYAPYDSPEAVFAANPQDEAGKALAMGRDVFNKTCSVCHQPNGLGKEGQFPPLVGSEWVLASSADRIVHIPLYGLSGPITVKGVQWNFVMPPLGENLTDQQIAAVLTFVRTKLGDNKGSPVKPELVKAARAENRRGPETSDDLLKIPLQ
jgi:mono/diheme cytochrome c family protein